MIRSVDFAWQRPSSEVLTRVAWTASRQELERPEPRADLAEALLRTYDAPWRYARATHRATYNTSWAQLATACGYQDDARVRRSLHRYLTLLQEAGLLNFGGARKLDGRWSHLVIELRDPPPLASVAPAGVAQSVGATVVVCDARRLRETRKQRDARRRRPWRRCGGRAEAVERRTLSWRSVSAHSLLEGGGPVGASHPTPDVCARARVGDACSGRDAIERADTANVSAAPNGVEDGPPAASATPATLAEAGKGNADADARAVARRQRKAEARRERYRIETRQAIRDGDLIPVWERERYAAAEGDPAAERELYGRFAAFLDAIPKDARS